MKIDLLTWQLSHAASVYETERQDTDKIRDRGSMYLSLMITPCFGVCAYLALNLRGNAFSCLNVSLFWTPWLASILLLLYVSYVCVRFAINTNAGYLKIPSPSAIGTYIDEMRTQDPAVKTPLSDAQLGLLREYEKCVDHISEVNQSKKSKLVSVQKFGAIAIVFILLSTPKWLYNFYTNDQEKLPVKILSTSISQNPNWNYGYYTNTPTSA